MAHLRPDPDSVFEYQGQSRIASCPLSARQNLLPSALTATLFGVEADGRNGFRPALIVVAGTLAIGLSQPPRTTSIRPI
jgi:hypothetical protein